MVNQLTYINNLKKLNVESEIIRKVILEHSTIQLTSCGIIEVVCLNDFCYDVTHLKEMLVAYEELIGNNKAPLLIIGGKYTSITPAARKFSATKESTRFSKAEAFVIHSLAQRILANFYLKMDKPEVPTKFFTNKILAEKWLKNFTR